MYDHKSVLTYVCTVLYCTPHLYIGHQDIKYEEFVSYIVIFMKGRKRGDLDRMIHVVE